MNFAEAYFTDLSTKGPNADFLQSYQARLLYKSAERLSLVYSFRTDTDTPYAKDAGLPTMVYPEVVDVPDPAPEGVQELFMSVAAGIINEAAADETNEFMRVRERMALYRQAINNARLFESQEQPSEEVFMDVRNFAKGVLMHQPRFPLHPAIVIGFGFNLADSVDNPYYGSQHVSWSLTDYQLAYTLAELFETKTRYLITQGGEPEFNESVKTILFEAQKDIELDADKILKTWAMDNGLSFAPLTRLYSAFEESPAPLPNTMQVFNRRIRAAYETSLTR
ncbi:MAG: hypothetical protein CMP20_15530 [Rickettsiales bacterium]|nr:hypothetical protein [Rickettsiales bacterium]